MNTNERLPVIINSSEWWAYFMNVLNGLLQVQQIGFQMNQKVSSADSREMKPTVVEESLVSNYSVNG